VQRVQHISGAGDRKVMFDDQLGKRFAKVPSHLPLRRFIRDVVERVPVPTKKSAAYSGCWWGYTWFSNGKGRENMNVTLSTSNMVIQNNIVNLGSRVK